MPERATPSERERELLRAVPPDRLTVLYDRVVTEPMTRPLDRYATRAYRGLLDVPDEVVQRAVARVRAQLAARTVTVRRIEALARWSPMSPRLRPG